MYIVPRESSGFKAQLAVRRERFAKIYGTPQVPAETKPTDKNRVRGDSGKWNDDPIVQHAPPIGKKPAKMSLDKKPAKLHVTLHVAAVDLSDRGN